MPTSELLLSRQDYDGGVKKKIIILGLNYHIAIFTSESRKIRNIPHHTASQLLEEKRKCRKKIKHKSYSSAQLPSSMLPVRCCSEKINICWKVQIDDKEPSLSLHLIQSKAWAHMTHEKNKVMLYGLRTPGTGL